jgi:hypothetical protein
MNALSTFCNSARKGSTIICLFTVSIIQLDNQHKENVFFLPCGSEKREGMITAE